MTLLRGVFFAGVLTCSALATAEEREWFPYCTNGSNTGNGYGWDPSVVDSNGSHSCLVPPAPEYPAPTPNYPGQPNNGGYPYPPSPGGYPPPQPGYPYPSYPPYPPQAPKGVNCLVRNLRGAEYKAFAHGYGQWSINAACDEALRQCFADSIIKLSCKVERTWAQ